MKRIAELVPEYEAELAALQKRRGELISRRRAARGFTRRDRFTRRIAALDQAIGSTAAALRAMLDYLAR